MDNTEVTNEIEYWISLRENMNDTEIINGVEYWISPTTGEYIPYTKEELARREQYERVMKAVSDDMVTRYGYMIRR